MITYNLKRAIKVRLLDDGLEGTEPRYKSVKTIRCAPAANMEPDGKFAHLAILDLVDEDGRIWHVGKWADGYEVFASPEARGGMDWDEWRAKGVRERQPSMVQISLDNIESVSVED
jgi:hypothetical protein